MYVVIIFLLLLVGCSTEKDLYGREVFITLSEIKEVKREGKTMWAMTWTTEDRMKITVFRLREPEEKIGSRITNIERLWYLK